MLGLRATRNPECLGLDHVEFLGLEQQLHRLPPRLTVRHEFRPAKSDARSAGIGVVESEDGSVIVWEQAGQTTERPACCAGYVM